jgi:hypothetical protein
MKLKIVFAALFFLFFTNVQAQKNQGKCSVNVSDYGRTVTFGYLVAYYVEFKNDSKKTVDGVYFTTKFYNNDGELISTKSESFNSSSLVDPIATGFTKKIARTPNIKGASKIAFVINKVHFTDGSSCE